MSRPLRRVGHFFSELKRRRVYRVAVAYLAVAFVGFEAVNLLIEPTTLPPYADELLLAFLIAGFPVALVVAWAFELTPEGLRKTAPAAREDGGAAASAAPTAAGEPLAQRAEGGATADLSSVGVLPFTDMSPEGDQEYFGDGIAEELINALTRMQGLKVAARTSAFSFKGRDADVREIGKTLGVGAILEGSVRKWENRVRVTAQLVTAEDGYHLWSDSYERELEDVFSIQDEIARSIVRALEVHLGPGEGEAVRPRRTEDLDAYILHLKGRHFWNQGTVNIPISLEFFQQAVERDPGYAPSQAGLAAAYATMALYGFTPPREVRGPGIQAAERALELDDSLPEVQTYAATARDWLQWDFRAGERGFRRALELNPRHVDGHFYLGQLLARLRRFDEARPHFDQALELDPLSPMAHFQAGAMGYFEGALDRAVRHFDDSLELDPGFLLSKWLRAYALLHSGRAERAVESMEPVVEEAGRPNLFLAALASAYAAAGRASEARELLGELEDRAEEGFVDGYLPGLACFVVGDLDRGFAWLEKAYEQRSPMLSYMGCDPVFDSLRDEPRYVDLVERLKLR